MKRSRVIGDAMGFQGVRRSDSRFPGKDLLSTRTTKLVPAFVAETNTDGERQARLISQHQRYASRHRRSPFCCERDSAPSRREQGATQPNYPTYGRGARSSY